MELVDRILAANDSWANGGFAGPAPVRPARRLAVVTCMDSRIDVFAALGLGNGEAHIIRNAGGIITDDVARSIALSQRRLGTVDVVVVQHTDCGMSGFDASSFRRELKEDTGEEPGWDVEGFVDVEESLRSQLAALRSSPWFRTDGEVAGFVYDVDTGRLRHVT
jgi:carbonic anhydrase